VKVIIGLAIILIRQQKSELTTANITLDDDRSSDIVNPDVNSAFVNESRAGSVATNDQMPVGTTYSTTTVLANATLTLSTDGSYTFTATAPGVYVYNIAACTPTTPPVCTTETLTITVLEKDAANAPPVANTDFAVGIQGTPVIVKTLANDDAGTAGAALVPSSVSIVSGTPDPTTQGTLSVDATTGDITFTPVAGFTGTVSYTYQVCDTNTPSACATATQTVTIYPTGSANILAAADDYNLTYQGASVGGNVLTNDSQVKAGSLTATPQTTTVAGVGTFTLLADGSYTFVPDPDFTGNTSFVYEVTGVDGVTAFATVYISVAETPTFNWTGAGDPENWCDPDNWDKGTVPSTAVNVDIKYDATNPTVKLSGTCDLCIKNLDVQANATLEVDGIRLCVTGDVNSAGFIDGTGSIHLRGTTLQTISGDFNITNLELENAAGATITAGPGNMVQITESLKLTRGTLTTNSNLRLMSDASGDAYLAPISDAECALVNIIGSVRIQKFVDGGNRAFRFISHPFDGTISLQQVRDYVHITGEGLDFNLSGNPSAFWYNTASGNQSQTGEDSGWVPVSSTNIGDWFKGRAVRMMFRGPRTQGGVVGDDDYNPSVVTYELIGEVNFCEQILTGLIRSGNPGDGTDTDKGDGLVGSSAFNFIGNPFPAAIDLKTIPPADRANLSGAYYLWQPRTGVQAGNTVFGPGGGRGGNYVTEPFDGGIPALGQLASGTGFFVFALVNNATIRFTEANKLAQKKLDPGAAVTFREDWQQTSRYGTNSLQLSLTTQGHEADRVLLYFDEDAYAIVDRRDATKFANPAINFFTVSEDNYALAIDRRPWVDDNEYKIPLFILSPAGAEYILKIPDFDLEIGRKLFLVDRMNLSRTEIKAGMEYTFKVTDDPKSKGHRFDIVMGIEVITSLETMSNRFQAFLLPNPAQEQVRISIQRPDNLADTHIRLVSMTGVVK
jgi:CshA-type fibril repeat protein